MSDGGGIKEGAAGNRIHFNRDVARLASGTALAQVLMALASPALTRLFAPEVFGTFTLFTSITGIIASVLCLRYDLAIVLPNIIMPRVRIILNCTTGGLHSENVLFEP